MCDKTSQVKTTYKKLRGHFNPTGKKRAYPNLQWVVDPQSPSGKRFKACTRCIKTLYRTREVKVKNVAAK